MITVVKKSIFIQDYSLKIPYQPKSKSGLSLGNICSFYSPKLFLIPDLATVLFCKTLISCQNAEMWGSCSMCSIFPSETVGHENRSESVFTFASAGVNRPRAVLKLKTCCTDIPASNHSLISFQEGWERHMLLELPVCRSGVV